MSKCADMSKLVTDALAPDDMPVALLFGSDVFAVVALRAYAAAIRAVMLGAPSMGLATLASQDRVSLLEKATWADRTANNMHDWGLVTKRAKFPV